LNNDAIQEFLTKFPSHNYNLYVRLDFNKVGCNFKNGKLYCPYNSVKLSSSSVHIGLYYSSALKKNF